MATIVSEAEQRVGFLAKEHNAEIVRPKSWPVAVGHGPWVEEIWVNYLSNAVKYGGQPPYIQLGSTPLDNHHVKFWVQDNGAGLTPEEQAQLFTPFTQLNKINVKGHGLGLSIVRRIVTKLGGEVDVSSSGEPGQGSTFSFTLPQQLGESPPVKQ